MYFFVRMTGHPHFWQELSMKNSHPWQMSCRRRISASEAMGIPAATCLAEETAKFLTLARNDGESFLVNGLMGAGCSSHGRSRNSP